MKEVLLVVDMQHDFVDGSLANPNAQTIVPKICNYILTDFKHRIKDMHDIRGYTTKDFHIILTKDTHSDNYLNTPEGRKLPVEHTIEETSGWCVVEDIIKAVRESGISYNYIHKRNFGYVDWEHALMENGELPEKIYICGTVTSICVVSNALILKALLPNAEIVVLSDLCADMDDEGQKAALKVMKNCQIEVI